MVMIHEYFMVEITQASVQRLLLQLVCLEYSDSVKALMFKRIHLNDLIVRTVAAQPSVRYIKWQRKRQPSCPPSPFDSFARRFYHNSSPCCPFHELDSYRTFSHSWGS